MNQLTDVQKAWLAGFVDGEGYVGITHQTKKETKTSSASSLYHPYLIIVNTNYEALKYIQKIVGDGHLYIANESSVSRKAAYQYKLTKMVILRVLLMNIIPYLKIKQKQALLLIDFIKRRLNTKPVLGRGYRGVTSFTEKDKKFYEQLLLLNKRGS